MTGVIEGIKAKSRWFVSGTPFPNKYVNVMRREILLMPLLRDVIENILVFLGCSRPTSSRQYVVTKY